MTHGGTPGRRLVADFQFGDVTLAAFDLAGAQEPPGPGFTTSTVIRLMGLAHPTVLYRM